MFWENFVMLCEAISKTPNAVAAEIGIASGTVTSWKKKKSFPRMAMLKRIGEYFHVTPESLLETKKEPAAEVKLSPIQEELFDLIISLDEARQKQAIDYIRYLSNQ